jgi:hypothetical protein
MTARMPDESPARGDAGVRRDGIVLRVRGLRNERSLRYEGKDWWRLVFGSEVLRPVVRLQRSANRRALHGAEGAFRWTVLSAVDVTLSAAEAALTSELGSEVADRIRASPLGDILEPLIVSALESDEVDHLIGRTVDSHVIDTVIKHLLEGEALWALVDTVAQSPAVMEAVSRQSLGFADQMAGVVRQRSLRADDRVEGLARRLARRTPRAAAAPLPEELPGA